MTVSSFFDRAWVATATTGTGTITLGAAQSGYATFAEAGYADGQQVSYVILDGADFEIGIGTYTASGATLSRTTVRLSKIGGTAGTSKINLSGSATVFATLAAEDLAASATTDTTNASNISSGTLNAARLPQTGIFDDEQYTNLSSGFAGSNATGAQPVFSSAQDVFTASASTLYGIDGYIVLVKTAGATSHTVSFLLGGTATFTSALIEAFPSQTASGLPASLQASTNLPVVTATPGTAIVLTGAITSASETVVIRVRGTLRVNAGGTIIPQYSLSAAPGGAYTTQTCSHFRMWNLGTNTDTLKGNWA